MKSSIRKSGKIIFLCLIGFLFNTCSKDHLYTESDFKKAIVIEFFYINGHFLSQTEFYTYVRCIGEQKTIMVTGDPRFLKGDTVWLYDKNLGRSKINEYFEKYRWGLASNKFIGKL